MRIEKSKGCVLTQVLDQIRDRRSEISRGVEGHVAQQAVFWCLFDDGAEFGPIVPSTELENVPADTISSAMIDLGSELPADKLRQLGEWAINEAKARGDGEQV